MAHRKNKALIRVDSEEVMGEGSYVTLKAPLWGDVQDLQGGNLTEKEVGMEMLKRVVVGWDWVDDEDKPLPLPSSDPDVLNRLQLVEMNFLSQAFDKHIKVGPAKN
jgi:hypothetical protein